MVQVTMTREDFLQYENTVAEVAQLREVNKRQAGVIGKLEEDYAKLEEDHKASVKHNDDLIGQLKIKERIIELQDEKVADEIPPVLKGDEPKDTNTDQTPCEKLGYKIGDRFKVTDISGHGFCLDDVVDFVSIDKDGTVELFSPLRGLTQWLEPYKIEKITEEE